MKKILGFWCVILFGLGLFAQNISAKVIGVKDGDTMAILFENKQIVVRLAHIDTPEKNQPFGLKAKQFASDFCFGKTVKSTFPIISVVSNDLNQSAPTLFLSSSSLMFLYFIGQSALVTVSSSMVLTNVYVLKLADLLFQR